MCEPNYRVLPAKQLLFDAHSPRLPESLEGAEQDKLSQYYEQRGVLDELETSIATNGFFAGAPLLVFPSEGVERKEEKFIVADGNRRLAALRRAGLNEAPCLVFDECEQARPLLGAVHSLGNLPWEPLQQARYLDQRFMAACSNMSRAQALERVARGAGVERHVATDLIAAFKVYQEIAAQAFYGFPGLHAANLDFWKLQVSIGYEAIRSQLFEDEPEALLPETVRPNAVRELAGWLYAPAQNGAPSVAEIEDIETLNDVLNHEAAAAAFREGNDLRKAARLAYGSSAQESYSRELDKDSDSNIEVSKSDSEGTFNKTDSSPIVRFYSSPSIKIPKKEKV